MPRTAKALTPLVENAGVDSAAALTALDAANGHSITAAGQFAGRLLVHIKNTAVAAKNVTFKQRTGNRSSDLVVSVPASGERIVCLGDSMDFEQAGEAYFMDLEAGTTGTFAVYSVPR